jgi:hypothetical protein
MTPGIADPTSTLTHDENLDDPLTWYLAASGTVWMRCPRGHVARLHPEHEIGANGNVEPSVICPNEDCDWHRMVTLTDWEAHR